MAYRRTLLLGSGRARLGWSVLQGALAACPLCHRAKAPRHWQSTLATKSARREVQEALGELAQEHANLVNLSWVQLAQQSLEQRAGDEVVRVAIWGLGGGTTAKRLLTTMLADALSEEQAWERELAAHDDALPLIVRVGASHEGRVRVRLDTTTALHELHVSSPHLGRLNVELLLVQATAPLAATSRRALEEAVLVPLVGIASAEHRISPLATPVHQALVVASGMPGAVCASALPISQSHDAVRAAVDLPGVPAKQPSCAFAVVDVSRAQESLRAIRLGPQHAREYERLWLESNVAALVDWLKTSARVAAAHTTKPAVRRHVAALLDNVSCAIEEQEQEQVASVHRTHTSLGGVSGRLAEWTHKAHAELQDELDLCFAGRRWRKLGWWKLFWRVDDVAMLTSDMLSQRFLPTAEQELVYLAGRIAELAPDAPRYPQPGAASYSHDLDAAAAPDSQAAAAPLNSLEPSSSKHQDSWFRSSPPSPPPPPPCALPKWPGHIAFTRRYLHHETVPALQSLAQSLVAQALGTVGATSSLAALLYLSSASATLYEVGAVAALGLVYSLARMQRKWDAARAYWQGEVREEGRKAIRGAEASVAVVLRRQDAPDDALRLGERDFGRARELVQTAKEALARIE
ncbi:hypothetical protein CDD82_3261 [Ophiocordyceps australis]|uniref:Mmc1 C-terminal domain-containing protein n=1 Tax=Ophiocordyceps australis TaxID=1399860 RepID=A0A2C5ZF10_9HYPO|nr:hypothetical protein CDD82_3261 [Ophiocordyceps australis]